jgi:hypothetical protein
MTKISRHFSVRFLSTLLCVMAFKVSAQPAAPIENPYLPSSAYPVAHGYGDLTPFAGPIGPGKTLQDGEVLWKPVGPINSYVPNFSEPYPDGRRVIWVGGYDRIAKLDAETMDILTTYAIGGGKYYGEEEIRRYISTADNLDPQEYDALEQKTWRDPYRYTATAYRLVTKDNELYIPHIDADGSMALRVYGETDATDPASDILLKREWKIPPELSRAKVMSVHMTYDGWVLMVTQDGLLVALTRDFSEVRTLMLPRRGDEPTEADFFAAFVRNGLTVDNNNGIYVVSRDFLHRVQWTGKQLSLDEKDGAWSVSYANDFGTGSGTTPTPMGWGPEEDHLVLMTDGAIGNNLVAYWRDKIPEDWQGLPGQPRRVAGIVKVSFGTPDDDRLQIENAPVIYGYGVFLNNFDNTFVRKNKPREGGAIQVRADNYVHMPGHDAPGAARLAWNPDTRSLETVWRSQRNFGNTVCTVSSATELVYCWGRKDNQWIFQGTDWDSGETAVEYVLGSSKRYDAMGGPIIIDHEGRAICSCSGGMGLVRIQPH